MDNVIRACEKSSGGNLLVFFNELGKIRIFRAFDWPSSVSGWHVTTKLDD